MSRLLSEPCPNCGSSESFRRIYEAVEVNGRVLTVIYCDKCPKAEVSRPEFPAIVTSKRTEDRPVIQAVPQREPTPTVDTPFSRLCSDINSKKVFVGMELGSKRGPNNPYRMKKVNFELEKSFNGSPYKIISDNGFEVTARAVNG